MVISFLQGYLAELHFALSPLKTLWHFGKYIFLAFLPKVRWEDWYPSVICALNIKWRSAARDGRNGEGGLQQWLWNSPTGTSNTSLICPLHLICLICAKAKRCKNNKSPFYGRRVTCPERLPDKQRRPQQASDTNPLICRSVRNSISLWWLLL